MTYLFRDSVFVCARFWPNSETCENTLDLSEKLCDTTLFCVKNNGNFDGTKLEDLFAQSLGSIESCTLSPQLY